MELLSLKTKNNLHSHKTHTHNHLMDKEKKKLGKRVHVINFNDFLKDKMPDSKPP